MNYLSVYLWGEEVGRLVWNQARRLSYFQFSPGKANRPDVAPLLCPVGNPLLNSLPIYGNPERIYQGLPPFIADSLPDSWGNKLFDQWVRQNGMSQSTITPLHKLTFIGRRGMGALEFVPAAQDLEHRQKIDLAALYDLSLEIASERDGEVISEADGITMQTLIAVGTSAGGRQMKAIIARNPETGEIRSGQTDGLEEYDYCIVKFEDSRVPTTEIEMAYYDMATSCGIAMEHCEIMNADGRRHFLTRRFDRRDGRKIHMQTLAAINPEAESYEQLMLTCRKLDLTEAEFIEVYRRLVFNVMANNTDDHNKNHSFLLEPRGRWRLSPAYDITFIFNIDGTGPEPHRRLTLFGKSAGITKDDLLDFARVNSIRNPGAIIDSVASAIGRFPELAARYDIPAPCSQIIATTLSHNLAAFGYSSSTAIAGAAAGRFKDVTISVNSKGHYDVRATVDGQPRRKFVRPNMAMYQALQQISLQNPADERLPDILDRLFPDSN